MCLVDIKFESKPMKGSRKKERGAWSFRKEQSIIGEWPLAWRKQYAEAYEAMVNRASSTMVNAATDTTDIPTDKADIEKAEMQNVRTRRRLVLPVTTRSRRRSSRFKKKSVSCEKMTVSDVESDPSLSDIDEFF